MTILLMGHPNVGKSAVFNRLTGANITESNYPGTTVDFTESYTFIGGKEAKIIDVPGTFSTEPKDEAEKVAMEILKEHEDAIVVAVLDATKVERGLYLALEIMEKNYPVVQTVAISGEGISNLANKITEASRIDAEKLEKRIENLQNEV